jgi:hypothetical protein
MGTVMRDSSATQPRDSRPEWLTDATDVLVVAALALALTLAALL